MNACNQMNCSTRLLACHIPIYCKVGPSAHYSWVATSTSHVCRVTLDCTDHGKSQAAVQASCRNLATLATDGDLLEHLTAPRPQEERS